MPEFSPRLAMGDENDRPRVAPAHALDSTVDMEEKIFLEALDHPPSEIPAFLDQACGGDVRLRARLESLMAAMATRNAPLSTQAMTAGQHVRALASNRAPETEVGRFVLEEEIGRGGFGIVYRARQQEPVVRQVALKILKRGMDTDQIVARFEAERQALASMSHPHIAQIYDGGTTDSGLPYFAMEYVQGAPITDYCDQRHLDLSTRLQLFIAVCDAVQHAHQRGIVHRDLKPLNVLVTEQNGEPIAKVIDFGIAKALEDPQLEHPILTVHEQLVGTPLYASPEQLAGLAGVADTRTDIYGMGVLLHELLCGAPPFGQDHLQAGGFVRFRELVLHEEPRRPSVCVASLAPEQLELTVRNRNTESKKLQQALRSDLDWVLLKALQKDPADRYQSISELRQDLLCVLGNQCVSASPPSTMHRVRKFASRHRVALAALTAVILSLIAGTIISTRQAIRANHAEEIASQRLDQIVSESEAKEQARAEALDRAREATDVLHFFQEKVLAAGRPEGQHHGLGVETSIRQAMVSAEQAVEEMFGNRPTVAASIHHTLGQTYHDLGRHDLAARQFERARHLRLDSLGPAHLHTLQTSYQLADAYWQIGRLRDGLILAQATVTQCRQTLGPDHPDSIRSIITLGNAYANSGQAEEAVEAYEEAQERARRALGLDHPTTLTASNNLPLAYRQAGRKEEALTLLLAMAETRNTDLGATHPDTLATLSNLAATYASMGRLEEALNLRLDLRDRQVNTLGPNHARVLLAQTNIANTHLKAGRPQRALPLLEATLQKQKEVLPARHLNLTYTLHTLALAHDRLGQYGKAVPRFEEVIRLRTETQGSTHPDTVTAIDNLAASLFKANRSEEAVPHWRTALECQRESLGPTHQRTLLTAGNLAIALDRCGRQGDALKLKEETTRAAENAFGPLHARTLALRSDLAISYYRNGRKEEALRLWKETLKQQTSQLGADHRDTELTRANLQRALTLEGEQSAPE